MLGIGKKIALLFHMKKILLTLAIAGLLFSCKKEKIDPLTIDQLQAKKYGLTLNQYLKVKGILTTQANQLILDNKHTSNDPFSMGY